MSKYVVISREGGDFSMDLIFAGLVRRFGKENVVDWPPRKKHRQGKPILSGDDEKDYGAERRSLCYTDGCEDMKEWTRAELIQSIHDIALVFTDETIESYVHFLEIFSIFAECPKVVIVAGHDNFRGNPNEVMSRYGKCHMFIDDWQKEYNQLKNTNLINLSCNFDHLWNVEKRDEYLANKIYDICFFGYNSHYIRKLVIDHVKRNWGHLNNKIVFEEKPNTFSSFVRHDKMFKTMAQSKICLNMPGASTTGRALRYYEIPYVGSFMISQWFPAKLLFPMPCPIFQDLNMLDKQIEDALSNDKEREIAAKKLHMHCIKYHTIDSRIDYIFQILAGKSQEELVMNG